MAVAWEDMNHEQRSRHMVHSSIRSESAQPQPRDNVLEMREREYARKQEVRSRKVDALRKARERHTAREGAVSVVDKSGRSLRT